MARFLSAEWFAEIARSAPPEANGAKAARASSCVLVLEQVVRDTPDGEVRYRVVVRGATAHIEPAAPQANGATTAPDLTIASDWATATALAQGRLSAQAALMAGRLRIRGSLARLTACGPGLAGIDPVPPDVRRRTTY
jgi:hypothetical protein